MRKSSICPLTCAVLLGVSLAACGRGADNAQRATPSDAARSQGPARGQQATAPATAPPAAPNASQPPGETPPPSVSARPPRTDNLVALEMGGRVETGKELSRLFALTMLLDDDPKTAWSSEVSAKFPQEIVLSFLGRDAATIAGVVLTLPPAGVNPTAGICPNEGTVWAKDVEIWTSMEGPNQGFSRVAATSLPMEPGDHPVAFPAPVEARFVKLVINSNHGCPQFTMLAGVAVREAQVTKSASFLGRHADLASLLSSAQTAAGPPPTPASVPVVAAQGDLCALPAPRDPAPRHVESRTVLVVSNDPERYAPFYYAKVDPESPSVRYFSGGPGDGRVDSSILRRLTFLIVPPEGAAPAALVPSAGVDTVVLPQVCDVRTSVSPSFKRALVDWIAAGHKLIIQDSDTCANGPDYSFLPYSFSTSNPGARGAASQLTIVENSFLVSKNASDPAFMDEESWRLEKNGNFKNDFGDSNMVTRYDAHWCGAVAGANAIHASGFVLAYARHGRGVVLYDGMDLDQRRSVAYRQYVLRQLLLPFDPDPLPCSVPLAPFVVTTDASLVARALAPGQTYTYPITVRSNQGAYQGPVRLSLASPTLAGLVARFDPETVALGAEATSTLTVTLPAAVPESWRMAVRGDASAARAALCLAANLRRTGRLTVANNVASPSASQKNLLIVLDLSGSMNLPLGKSTRIATARQVLRDVLKRIPDDFNVGLRLYGHRYGSRQKETCTDSELVVPVRRLDRDLISKAIDRLRPRGETPLVYSVLQAAADLKAAAGGSVVLITDGEESCGGDFAAATSVLKQSGLDLRLSIVGFTLTDQKARQPLAAIAGATGGSYYTAEDGAALTRALGAATISRFPFSVVSASGATVAHGEAGDKGQELPPGEYKVVARAGDE